MHHSAEDILFKCKECDYSSTRKDNLQRHKKLKHNTYNVDFDALKQNVQFQHGVYKCPECNGKFYSEKTIEDHILLKKCKEIECDICGKGFKLKQHLKRHLKNVHKK